MAPTLSSGGRLRRFVKGLEIGGMRLFDESVSGCFPMRAAIWEEFRRELGESRLTEVDDGLPIGAS